VGLTLDALQENKLATWVKVLRDGEEAVNYIFGMGTHDLCDSQRSFHFSEL
jgi:hypothetical protein